MRNNQVSSAGENYKHRKNNNTKNLSSSERKAHNILESKKVEIIGDSMLYGINEKGLCKGHKVKVRSYPGSTTEDICDYINPAIRRKPDVVIIHSGTNDLSHEIQTINKMKSVVKQVPKLYSQHQNCNLWSDWKERQKRSRSKGERLKLSIKKLLQATKH